MFRNRTSLHLSSIDSRVQQEMDAPLCFSDRMVNYLAIKANKWSKFTVFLLFVIESKIYRWPSFYIDNRYPEC